MLSAPHGTQVFRAKYQVSFADGQVQSSLEGKARTWLRCVSPTGQWRGSQVPLLVARYFSRPCHVGVTQADIKLIIWSVYFSWNS